MIVPILRPISLSTMATNMPFLYQTRSMSRLSQRQFSAFWQNRNISSRQCVYSSDKSCSPSAHRWISTSPSMQRKHETQPPSEVSHRSMVKPEVSYRSIFADNTGSNIPNIHDLSANSRVSHQRSGRNGRNGTEDTANFEKTDDLEELKDLKNLYTSTKDDRPMQGRSTEIKRAGMDDFDILVDDEEADWEDFEAEPMGLKTARFEDEDIEESKQKHGRRTWTITVEEKNAFQRIFSNIFERRTTNESLPETSFSANIKNISDQRRQRKVAGAKLHNIMSAAIGKLDSKLNKPDFGSILEQYPEALRETAAKAMGIVKESKRSEDQAVVYSKEDLEKFMRLETLREPERVRVETLMQNAKTDVELWNVMETEVFSLIPKLGLQDPKIEEEPSNNKSRKKRGVKSKRESENNEKPPSDEAQDRGEVIHSRSENGISPLVIHGPLYPSYLLLGLRLLDRSFAKPSPLTISLLPKIKSLGYISHVLGASTQFYNELLRIYHYRLDDFSGMIELLKEMENGALEMDRTTLEIVFDVIKAQTMVKNGQRGEALETLWKFPRYAPKEFKMWKSRIEDSLDGLAKEKEYSNTLKTWEGV